MGLRFTIDKQRRLIVTVAEGRVVFDDIRSHQDRLLADPEFDATLDQLIDTTTATEFALSVAEARTIAERPMLSPESRRAVVAQAVHLRPGAHDGNLS